MQGGWHSRHWCLSLSQANGIGVPLLSFGWGAVVYVQPARVKAIAPFALHYGLESPAAREETLAAFFLVCFGGMNR
jgi:hypothetical protein